MEPAPALRYFLEVARTGSINQASAHLHVAASAISRQIARLEHEVGVPLFERRPRGMVLSEAGEMLAAHARRSQLESEQVLADLRGLGTLRHSTVRIASSEGFARGFLPEAVVSFRETHPGVRFHLHVTTPGDATRRVRDGEADLAVTYSLAPEEGIKVEYALRQPILALVPTGHPLAGRTELWISDLLPYPLGLMEQTTTIRQLFDICASLEDLTFQPVFVSNDSGALHAFARLRGGIIMAGQLTVRGSGVGEDVVAIPVRNPELAERSVQIQSMARRVLPVAVQTFLTHLMERMDGA
ncbi:LysR family transcriptional regulator [Streptomyces inhibens]|uniref:LysR family transcriptional regulator n=1 Tax=Streptomyces inhibens TaxID=2293571 RepID=UPI001EE6CE6D|nr:LysR family transcriptional regulator [Streptomyces inhibens]UKY55019.1 LysR family transcriptional regulator [Streptomyces inhibens]